MTTIDLERRRRRRTMHGLRPRNAYTEDLSMDICGDGLGAWVLRHTY